MLLILGMQWTRSCKTWNCNCQTIEQSSQPPLPHLSTPPHLQIRNKGCPTRETWKRDVGEETTTNNMFINPEGFVYPCLSQKIGNVKDKSLKELFNAPQYCCFRKNLKANGGTFGACQLCCELLRR